MKTTTENKSYARKHVHTYTRLLWYPPILAYHRVLPTPDTTTPTVSVEVFEEQMNALRRRWNPIPLEQLVHALETDDPIPERAVVVTFDDGTEDTFTHALPVMKKYRIPATVFSIASNIGQPGSLNPDQIQTMQAEGITFGSHTLSHAYLPEMPLSRAEEALSSSQALIARVTGKPVELLSYPAGGFTPEILKVVRLFGYRAACTTNRGFKRFPIDRWALRRITMHSGGKSPFGMWVRCSGYYGLNRRLRNPS